MTFVVTIRWLIVKDWVVICSCRIKKQVWWNGNASPGIRYKLSYFSYLFKTTQKFYSLLVCTPILYIINANWLHVSYYLIQVYITRIPHHRCWHKKYNAQEKCSGEYWTKELISKSSFPRTLAYNIVHFMESEHPVSERSHQQGHLPISLFYGCLCLGV